MGEQVVWTLADRLIKARKMADLTQQEIADWCGISLRSVVNYEKSKGKPNRAVKMAWAARCGVSFDFLEGTADLGIHASGWLSENVGA